MLLHQQAKFIDKGQQSLQTQRILYLCHLRPKISEAVVGLPFMFGQHFVKTAVHIFHKVHDIFLCRLLSVLFCKHFSVFQHLREVVPLILCVHVINPLVNFTIFFAGAVDA